MTSLDHFDHVVDGLSDALDQGQIPKQYLEMGRQLLSHLRKSVRVVIMGPGGCGKSTLLNMILAKDVVGRDSHAPVIEIAHGDAEHVSFEDREGRFTRHGGLLCDLSIPDATVRARQELTSPDLIGMSYFEISVGEGQYAESVLNWVSEWADIVLWCTEEFAEDERALWRSVPDTLKDRSCLVLAKADHQVATRSLETTTAELGAVVADEFFGLFPVASQQALRARTENTGSSAGLWESSGGQRLVGALAKLIAQGRAEDLDRARMLVEMYAPPTPIPANSDLGFGIDHNEIDRTPGVQTADQISVPNDVDPDAARQYDHALTILENGAERLLDLATETAVDCEQVITVCKDTLARISDHFSTSAPEESHQSETFRDVQEGQEMVLMCELEGCEDAATDAVTVLLQLKKEFREKSRLVH